jgi:predicted ester cyclase
MMIIPIIGSALQTTITDNLRLVERAWVDSINRRSEESFLDLHKESVVLFDPTLGSLKGRPALAKMWKGLFSMFPDYQIRKVRSFGQEDWVCLEVEESGTMKGPIHVGPKEIPPTGKSFKIPSSIIARVESGRIGEVRLYYDVLGLMGQLGLGP